MTADTSPKRGSVSPAHRVYLYAFDLYIGAHDEDERQALWSIMRRAAADAGIPCSTRPDRTHDLVDLVAAHMKRDRPMARSQGA